MNERLSGGVIELNTFLKWQDSTTLDRLDPSLRDLEAKKTSYTWILLPDGRKRERWQPYLVVVTGPSQMIVLSTALDATEDTGDVMAALEIAAEAGNETAFMQAASGVDWLQRPAADCARAVRLALAAGAHLLARKLATQGSRLHPDHLELRKMAHILAPPRVVDADIPPTPSLRANQTWLRGHGHEHKGQWVALREGTLLAVGAKAREVWDRLESTDGVMLTKVF